MGEGDRMLGVDEVAEMAGVDPRTVARRAAEGKYPGAAKVKGQWQIPQAVAGVKRNAPPLVVFDLSGLSDEALALLTLFARAAGGAGGPVLISSIATACMIEGHRRAGSLPAGAPHTLTVSPADVSRLTEHAMALIEFSNAQGKIEHVPAVPVGPETDERRPMHPSRWYEISTFLIWIHGQLRSPIGAPVMIPLSVLAAELSDPDPEKREAAIQRRIKQAEREAQRQAVLDLIRQAKEGPVS